MEREQEQKTHELCNAQSHASFIESPIRNG
jgi:hypothetical protein